MKIFSLVLIGAGLLAATPIASAKADDASGIKLGLQAYTFRDFTFAETLDQAKAAGIDFLQAYNGQALGGGIAGNFTYKMDEPTRAKILALLKTKGVRLVSYGVVTGQNEDEWRQIFAFAKAMGLAEIASEPKADAIPLVDSLAKSTGIRVALHNHPTPSIYANPTFALETVKPLDAHWGLCADTGHWVRSGYDPVASLREAEGRIIQLHFKDLTERGVKSAHDVPWGTGASDAAGQIAELRRQHFNGYVFIEYEHNDAALTENVIRSAEFFRRALKASNDALVRHDVVPPQFTDRPDELWAHGRGKDSARWAPPSPLFAADLSNADYNAGAWSWKDGVLASKGGGGDIWTKETYGDFVVMLEFRCATGTNSGVFLRGTDPINWLQHSIEVQILQGDADDDKHLVGAIFDCLAPTRQIEIKPGEWYQYVITAKGNTITVTLNGEDIVKANLDQWTEPHQNPDGTKNKFDTAYKDLPRVGRIGLQDHGMPVEFRNLFVERL